MSEYQYYEFQAIDRPLTREQQAQIRTLSSRVQPTPTRAVFTYNWGDFPGDPLKVLAEHFDAMVYIADWGSYQLAFRLPRQAVDVEQLRPYIIEIESEYEDDGLSIRANTKHVILNIQYHAEPDDWVEEDGALGTLAPLREDILRRDFRSLYLAWLKAASAMADFDDEDEDQDEDEDWDNDRDGQVGNRIEPPVPPGLAQLTAPLQAFCEFLAIDPDLVKAAATASPRLEQTSEPLEEWITRLSEAERNAFLLRVARGETHVGVELLRRLREVGRPAQKDASIASAPRRSFSEIAAGAAIRAHRQEQERRAAEQARLLRLKALAQHEPQAWQQVTTLIEQKQGRAYDEAVALLTELHALAQHRGDLEQFRARMNTICEQYARSKTLLDRLRKAHLL